MVPGQEAWMDSRALSKSDSTQTSTIRHEGRPVWVLTAYGISGLVLLAVLAYYFSDYIAH